MSNNLIQEHLRNKSGAALEYAENHSLLSRLGVHIHARVDCRRQREGLCRWCIVGINIESEAANECTLLRTRLQYGFTLRVLHRHPAVSMGNITDKEFVLFTESHAGATVYQAASRRKVFVNMKNQF